MAHHLNMRNFIWFFTSVLSLTICSVTWADETIYTWQDQQSDLTNYAAIPPDDQFGSGNLKVFNPEIGLTTSASLPARDPLILNDGKTVLPGTAAPANTMPVAPTPAGAVISQTPGSAPAPATNSTKTTEIAPGTDPLKPASNTRILTQGSSSSQQTIYPVDDPEQKRKISEQVDKIEASAKTAKRVAEERRLEEMKDLAERVRNGAATKKEIAALMMYRQTASFRDARKAMAAPVRTVKEQSFE